MQVHIAATHPHNEVGVLGAGTPSAAHHFSALIHNVTSPRSDQGRAASGRSRQNSESEQKQLLPGSAPLDTVVTSTAGINSLVHALSVDTPSPSPGSRSNQHHTAFTPHTYTADVHAYATDAPQQHVAHGSNAQLSENPVGPTGSELSDNTPRCDDRSPKCNMNSTRFSTSNSSTAECTPLVQPQQQQQQSTDTLPLCQTHSSHVNGWSQGEVVGKHLAHRERFSWVHGGTLSRVLGKVSGNRHLLLLSLWWVAVSGPVMVFTESFCSNLFAGTFAALYSYLCSGVVCAILQLLHSVAHSTLRVLVVSICAYVVVVAHAESSSACPSENRICWLFHPGSHSPLVSRGVVSFTKPTFSNSGSK